MTALLFLLGPALSLAQPVRGVAGDLWADHILGQPDDGTLNYAFGEIKFNEAVSTGLFNPYSVVVDNVPGHNMLYVYDSGNNRILGVTMIGGQVTTGQGAMMVLGQPDFARTSCNGDSNWQNYPTPPIPNASCLCTLAYFQQSPAEGGSVGNMAVDSQGNLYVPDYWNNRVLRYNWPTSTGEAATAVWGQPDFNGYAPNNAGGNVTGGPTKTTLNFYGTGCNQYAAGVAVDNWGNLWVTDKSNCRVLRFPAPNPGTANPGLPSTTADMVLGQSNFTNATVGDGTSLNGFYEPVAVRVDSQGNVYVADGTPSGCPVNGRVLVYKPTGSVIGSGQPLYGSIATSAAPSADFQFGQTYVNRPVGLEWDPPTGNLWVTDFTGSAVGPSVGQAILFQVNVGAGTATAVKVVMKDYPASSGGPTSGSISGDIPPGTFTDQAGTAVLNWTFPDPRGSVGVDTQGNVYATDDRIDDVWRFPAPIPTFAPAPSGVAHSADVRIFNPMQFDEFNHRTTDHPTGMDSAHGIAVPVWGGVTQVIAAEGYRLMYWNMPASGPSALLNGQAADGVAGVPVTGNPALEILPRIGRIREDAVGHLWTLRSIDGSPSRIEVYNLPLTPLATPSAVINGPFSVLGGGTVNWTWLEGIAPSADGTSVWVSNREYNRVFHLRNALTSPMVDVILGQPNATSTLANYPGGTPSASNLNTPGAVELDHHGYLYVSDHGLEDGGNYRMLRWNPNTLANAITRAANTGTAQFALPADGVYGTNGSFTAQGCYPYNFSIPAPGICGPWEPAFNSDDSIMVVGQNSQGPGQRFPVVFSQPESGDNPVTYLKDFGPQTFSAAFDAQDNLYMGELNRSRILVYVQPFGTQGPTLTPTSSPTPTISPTWTASPTGTWYTSTPSSTFTWTSSPTPTLTPNPLCCQAASPWTAPSLTGAAGVAVDISRHRVYAPDRGTGTLFAYNYQGTPVTAFGVNGAVTGLSAFCVAVGNCAYDGVYIVQRQNPTGAVVKLDASGNVVWTSGNVNGGANRSLAVDNQGTAYVCDDSGDIWLLDNTGTVRNTLSGYGFSAPTGTLKMGSTLYVDDTVNNQIVALPQTGAYTYGAGTTVVPSVTSPYVLTADLAGNYYVASSNTNSFYVYDNSWALQHTCTGSLLAGAFGIATDETGAVYVAGQASNTVQKMQACYSQPAPTACVPTATATPTGTWFTATPTSTPSLTPTRTDTPSLTPTFSKTPTPTNTPTSTVTSTPSPTLTFTPSTTPTEGCHDPGIYPNPVKDQDNFTVHFSPCDQGSACKIRIFTVAYRKVMEAQIQQVPTGGNLSFPLKDDWGTPLANGLYFLVVDKPNGVRSIESLLILR